MGALAMVASLEIGVGIETFLGREATSWPVDGFPTYIIPTCVVWRLWQHPFSTDLPSNT